MSELFVKRTSQPLKHCITQQAANLGDRRCKSLAPSLSRKRPAFGVADPVKAEGGPAAISNLTPAGQPVDSTADMLGNDDCLIADRLGSPRDPGLMDRQSGDRLLHECFDRRERLRPGDGKILHRLSDRLIEPHRAESRRRIGKVVDRNL